MSSSFVISSSSTRSLNKINRSDISTKACLISRYTVPKKFNGKINCSIIAFNPTKPPTDKSPFITCFVATTISASKPDVTMSACPKLSIDSDTPVLMAKNS